MAQHDIQLSDKWWDRVRFRIEHRLLSMGSRDAARMRGYLRLKRWRDCRTMSERLHAIGTAALVPINALKEAIGGTRAHGVRIAPAGRSLSTQFAHLLWLRLRHGIHSSVYYTFRLYEPGQLRRAPSFLQNDEQRIYRLLNVRTAPDEVRLLGDKRKFERWLEERGFPTVCTIAEFVDGEIISSPPGTLPRADLFSKPNDGRQGNGAIHWSFINQGWRAGSQVYDDAQLIEQLRHLSLGGALLLQPALRPHSGMAAVCPNALGTVRVITLRRLDGSIVVPLAVCKMPTGDTPVDTMRKGGISAPVDLATGRIGQGIRKSASTYIEVCQHHPDTGIRIDGLQLPHWQRVLELATEVHGALPKLTCIGWDIAILEDGPIIIEGNSQPGHALSQAPTQLGIGETEILSTVIARLRASFDSQLHSVGTAASKVV